MAVPIVLLGHVDHGKSTLIGRIVYDTKSLPKEKLEEIKLVAESLGQKLEFAHIVDVLEEERKHQKTIESTQTFFKSKKRDYVLIDVPGHKEHLKNMITGASQANFGILIVDVTEGVKEQTKRHAYLAKLLGISKLIVVINKMDLVGYDKERFEKVKREVVDYLSKIGVRVKHLIPISAYKGDNVIKNSKNMKWYRGKTLLGVLDSLKQPKKFKDTRIVIQDSFKINKNKIFFGNLVVGSLSINDSLLVFPTKKRIKIKKILDGNKLIKKISAPKAIGIKVTSKLKRGDVLVNKIEPVVTKKLNTKIFCISGRVKEGDDFLIRIFTQESKCKIEKIKSIVDIRTLKQRRGKIIKEMEIGVVKVKTTKPVVVESLNKVKELGRFVLVRNGEIVAGGVVEL